MSWYVAPALDKLRDELNAKHPGRDRSSDGAIGDPSHQARKSDHNPDWAAGGVVRARDFDVDGIDVDALVAELLGDVRTRYVIYNRRIATRVPGGFRWDPYTGINPHTGHIHVSVRVGTQYENDTSPWFAPAITTTQEDDMALYLVGDKAPEVYAFDTVTGERRYVAAAEYLAVTAAGVQVRKIPQSRLDALPKVAGSR
ncbi:hypothetical protein [Cellulosimicrobium funkei]|uniref:hypothetical protein n=1 Tax=Cellulosimicrobium funkei TaxID=264251 RepID=UPI003426C654